MNVLLIGSGAREHALARAVARSPQRPLLACLASSRNPGIQVLCKHYQVGDINDPDTVAAAAKTARAELAIVGPEAPLAAGVVDALESSGVPCVGPRQSPARIETSKAFARRLLTGYGIPGCPRYQVFHDLQGVPEFLQTLGDNFVVKYDGLRGGKGVKVSGDHLHSHREALEYCRELAAAGEPFVVEEKLEGQEFSLMSFSDGEHLAHMPPVQDHKRAYEDDRGPNTGGMGSYSDADLSLPFLQPDDLRQAIRINTATLAALKDATGHGYRGILYGGFMVTAGGIRLIEYNARFGDPEALNVLPLLRTDFLAICQSITNHSLHAGLVRFYHRATVCKYAVPEGYPDAPVKNKRIDVSRVSRPEQLYYAAVDQREDGLYATGSRSVAVVGMDLTLAGAEAQAEAELQRITGPLFHRRDIGTSALIRKRVEHMQSLRKKKGTNPKAAGSGSAGPQESKPAV